MPKAITLSWKEYEKLTATANGSAELEQLEETNEILSEKLKDADRRLAELKATYEHTLGAYRAQKAELLEVCSQRDTHREKLNEVRRALSEVKSQDIELLATQSALDNLWLVTDEALRRTRPAGTVALAKPKELIARERKIIIAANSPYLEG
jgi:chromosome segregation ATPase